MKHLRSASKVLPCVFFLTSALSLGTLNLVASVCTPTGFIRDSVNLTAAMINPVGTVNSTIDATGCNIGIYYGPKSAAVTGTVSGATITGASSFGIVNDGANVTIDSTTIHDVGLNHTFADQGYAIYFATGSGAQGSVNGNFIWNYGIAGIVVNGGLGADLNASVPITNNSVTGLGPTAAIAQTAIQLGFGALGNVSGNTVTSNNYNGPNGGGGYAILVFAGACYAKPPYKSPTVNGITVDGNILVANNVGIGVFNLDASCNTSTHVSAFQVEGNLIRKYGVTSKSGYSTDPPEGYQAGIEDAGKHDTITGNNICGNGYAPVTPPPYLYFIDSTAALSPIINSNTISKICPTGSSAGPLVPDASAGSFLGQATDGIPHGPLVPVVRP